MKRRVVAVLAVVVAGMLLSAVPAAARDGESNDWNIPLTNIGL
ncbi:hypothetical protein ACFZCP_20895 [Streptomyces sp. NPDC007971]